VTDGRSAGATHDRSDRIERRTEQDDTVNHGQWNTNLNDYVAWCAANGRHPRNGPNADPAEKRQARWANGQRKHRKAGVLSPERVAALEAIPGWAWTAR
jgi:hypothetical protein